MLFSSSIFYKSEDMKCKFKDVCSSNCAAVIRLLSLLFIQPLGVFWRQARCWISFYVFIFLQTQKGNLLLQWRKQLTWGSNSCPHSLHAGFSLEARNSVATIPSFQLARRFLPHVQFWGSIRTLVEKKDSLASLILPEHIFHAWGLRRNIHSV